MYKYGAFDSNLFNSDACIELSSHRNQGDKNITIIKSDYMYPQIRVQQSNTKFCLYFYCTYEYIVKKYVFLYPTSSIEIVWIK
jgi:hypothetical protein